MCYNCIFNWSILDTLWIHWSNNDQGHIVLYLTLLISNVLKILQQINCQDMVFICPPGISALFSSGWITSGSATRQSPAPVQNSYEDRRRHAVLLLQLFFCAGRVHSVQHWPPEVRSYIAYFAYSEVLFVYLSLAGSVSICNSLRALWDKTSLVCDSSVLHTGTPSSCSSWSDWNNTLCHASGISWLSWSFLRQIREQWWWL